MLPARRVVRLFPLHSNWSPPKSSSGQCCDRHFLSSYYYRHIIIVSSSHSIETIVSQFESLQQNILRIPVRVYLLRRHYVWDTPQDEECDRPRPLLTWPTLARSASLSARSIGPELLLWTSLSRLRRSSNDTNLTSAKYVIIRYNKRMKKGG